MEDTTNARLRRIPAAHGFYAALGAESAKVWQRQAVEEVLNWARAEVRAGRDLPTRQELLDRMRARVKTLERPSLRPLINATGVIIHTNLGRSPLPPAVLDQVRAVAEGYSTLEYQLTAGARGSRHDHVARLLSQLSGAEAAMVVNNNAAAVLLALTVLARDGEAVVSRGQLVEIGGSFRIPEVMALSGARLVEVGATNKTHLRDYERAISDQTRVLMRVHTSNFRLIGFTAEVPRGDLVALGAQHGIPVMEDLGSGVVDGLTIDAYTEPSVREVVAAGVDVVTFSGDKLWGGPQAGVIVGRTGLIERMKRHPLARAIRVDKMTLAGLEAVARLYLEGREGELPLWQMIRQDGATLSRRARRIALRLGRRIGSDAAIGVAADVSEIGGGSMPGARLDTWVVTLAPGPKGAEALDGALRAARVPVVARIHEGVVRFDLRTVLPGQERTLVDSIGEAWESLYELPG